MNTVAKLTQKQIEKLAVEIRTFLLEHDMWVDTQIYFNGKCFDTHDKETGEFYYNDTRTGRNNGRIYPYYDDAVYRIDGREGE